MAEQWISVYLSAVM